MKDEPRLDLSATWGVPGWRWRGRHFRLSEIIAQMPERREALMSEHLDGMTLLAMCHAHLQDQFYEV